MISVQLEYFQLNSYYRLLIHKIGDYYGLSRQIDNSRNCIILYKTNATVAVPRQKLQDMSRKFKIMKRLQEERKDFIKSDTKQEVKDSVEEREAIYKATRARIFSQDSVQSLGHDSQDFRVMRPIEHDQSFLGQSPWYDSNNVHYPYILDTSPTYFIDQSQMYTWNHNFPTLDVNRLQPLTRPRSMLTYNLKLEPWP